MKNLWEETIKVLNENGKTFDDVISIFGNDFTISKENFEAVAKETYYDSGYGWQLIAMDLTILGEGWWLVRGEYDGKEWWEFKTYPMPPNKVKKITTLIGVWSTLEECNKARTYEVTK